MTTAPTFLQDAKELLTDKGFATSETWYHGTSSALIAAIKQQGLKRSGDKALKAAAQKTMATIGDAYTESIEPVFLTQSSELAYYWALQTVRERNVRIQAQEPNSNDEQPIVFEVKLPPALNAQVKPDVGAASLLLIKEGENFMAYLAAIYQEHNLGIPEIDLMKADRTEYLSTLGMAYFDADIDATYVTVLAG